MSHAEKLIGKIKAEDITPRPKWQVMAGRAAIRGAWIFSVLFGAISFSVILFVINEAGINFSDLFDRAGRSGFEMLLGLMPVIWIVFLMAFLALSIFGFRHAPRGYKFTLRKILGISTASSILIGTFLFLIGGGQFAERFFDASFQSYKGVSQRKIEVWSQPDHGYLSGKILEVGPVDMDIRDFNGNDWSILYTDAFIAGRVELVVGEQVKFIGEKLADNIFVATEIRPWGRGKGAGMGTGRGKKKGKKHSGNKKRGQE